MWFDMGTGAFHVVLHDFGQTSELFAPEPKISNSVYKYLLNN